MRIAAVSFYGPHGLQTTRAGHEVRSLTLDDRYVWVERYEDEPAPLPLALVAALYPQPRHLRLVAAA